MLFKKYFILEVSWWEVSKYGIFSGLYFPAFGLNKERYFLSIRIQSECGKIRTRKTPYLDSFHALKLISNRDSNFRIMLYCYFEDLAFLENNTV